MTPSLPPSCTTHLLRVERLLVLVVESEVVTLREQGFLVLYQAHVPTPVQNGMEKVVLFVATTNQLIAHPVIDVEQVVSVLSGIFDQFRG